MSPSLPQKTNFSASLTGFPIWEMSLWMFWTHGYDENRTKNLIDTKELCYLIRLLNKLINEDHSVEAAVWALRPSCKTEPLSIRVNAWKNLIVSVCVIVWASDLRLACKLNFLCFSCICSSTVQYNVCITTRGRFCDPHRRVWTNHLYVHSLLESLHFLNFIMVFVTLGAMFLWTWAPVRDTWGKIVSDEELVKRIVLRSTTDCIFGGSG